MAELLPAGPLLGVFLAASLVLAVTPGPGVIYIVTRTVVQGRGAGFASVYGVALGNFCNALAAALGLAAVLATSATAFAALKYAGAAYLVWLGIRALRAEPEPERGIPASPLGAGRAFGDGFLVALLNPKTALFFAAFLPQFMTGDAAPFVQAAALAAVFVAIAVATDSLYVLVATALAPGLSHRPGLTTLGRWLGGGVYIGLGVLAAAGGPRHDR